MSIRLKLILGALAFLLLFVAVYAVTASVTSDQKTDGVVINLAGRQRMLAERMSKQLLSYVDSPRDETWQAFSGTRMTFETTHAALRDGGLAPTQLLSAEIDEMGDAVPLPEGTLPEGTPTARMPKPDDAVILQKLEQAESLMETFVTAARKAREAARTAKDEGDLLVFLIPQLLARLQAAADQAQKESLNEVLNEDSKAELLKAVRYVSRQRLIAQSLGTLALNYLRSPNDKEIKRELATAIDVFRTTHEGLVNGGSVVIDLTDLETTELLAGVPNRRFQSRMSEVTDDWKEIEVRLERLETAGQEKAAAIDRAVLQSPRIVQAMNAMVLRSQTLSERRVATVQIVQIVALGLGILFVIIAAWLGNRIGRSMQEAVGVARTIADGDLTGRCESTAGDETGQLMASLNAMSEELSQLVQSVQHSGASVGASAGQISTSARRQESAVSELAASSTQIAATSSEISATANELLETMHEVGEVSAQTVASAGTGKQCLDEMRRTMDQMVESTDSIQDRLAAISEKTAKISTVVTTIMKIAQQTNLISLNAAIEAENAGELGLGFAVVAKEVRRLADQTSKASKGIEQMVKEMQSAVATAVMGMDGFSEDIRGGTDAVQSVTSELGSIIDQIERIGPQFDSVREGMTAQAQGAGQIADGVRQIVASSEETAESVRETTAAIDELSVAATQLQEGVARFKIAKNGSS